MKIFQSLSKTTKSDLYNESTFYGEFLKDLSESRDEIIIESPYITSQRMETFYQVFQRLLHKGVRIHVFTRDPVEHEDEFFRHQATNEILEMTDMGVHCILITGFHHRKLAVIDRKVVWEGSLNILSQVSSIEMMKRTYDKDHAMKMFRFLKYSKFI